MTEGVDALERAILGFLQEKSDAALRGLAVTRETPLFDSGALDSLLIIEFALFLEQRFQVRIEAHEIDRRNFATVSAVARLVAAKQGPR
ncbi:MAG: hypothetical protein HY554_01985 [Elusimicrobia bacterium]|nr:hypothetical protein [Elusimicrobiota bacterium]